MPVVIKISQETDVVSLISGASFQYLQDYDIEAYDGRGWAIGTNDLKKAKRFASMSEAIDAWNTQSKVRPLREDGKPNKPLTAFSASFHNVEE